VPSPIERNGEYTEANDWIASAEPPNFTSSSECPVKLIGYQELTDLILQSGI